MSEFLPEGLLSSTPFNRAALSGVSSLKDAMLRESVLEARASLCDKEHNIHVDLGCMKGIIERNDGALGIEEGKVRDIALISRVSKPVCFVVKTFRKDERGRLYAVLSRRRAQEKCMEEYINKLEPGDIITVRVSHIENFGVFCDIGAGISGLLPIDAVSVSRIPHPNVRFFPGQMIKVIVKSVDGEGRVTLSHKELLGTWAENAALFSVGETVPGIVRSVESYGIFIELTPNLAGLAEYNPDVKEGQSAAVYVKSILPERMKIKLVIVDAFDEKPPLSPVKYFFEGERMFSFRYSPPECEKLNETVFV